jgi:tetratricopeptide (TPR) repeat protein
MSSTTADGRLACQGVSLGIGDTSVTQKVDTIIRGQFMPQQATRSIAKPIDSSNPPEARRIALAVTSESVETPRLQLSEFVVEQPLSRFYPISNKISRLVMDADRDIARGRLESALDLTLLAETVEPGCIGLFVRQAELLLATGRSNSAIQIVAAIASSPDAAEGSSVQVESERILTHAQPTEENVIHLARTALASGRLDLVDRYMPIAIATASLQRDGSLPVDLAQGWLRVRPDNLDAAFTLTREMLRSGNLAEAQSVATNLPESAVDLRTTIIKLVLESGNGSAKQWEVLAALLDGIGIKKFVAARAQALLSEMIEVQPTNESLLVHRGVVEMHSGNPENAHLLLRSIRPDDPFANYVAAVSAARAALAAGDAASASDALNHSLQLYEQPEIAKFSATCPVLRVPYDVYSIGKSVAGALQQQGEATEAAALLERLSRLAPDRQDLSRAFADALARSGKRDIALARLEAMLAQNEKKGEFEGVQLTIQAMLQIAPGNLRLRARLIDEFMKRGMLQDAVNERWTQAQILERAGRVDDAIEQLRRASDVSSVLGDWKKLESILRLMIRMRPDDMDVRHSAATKFIEFGQIQLAIEQLWGVVDISTRQNNPDDTIAALHQIIALGPQGIDAYHRLGEVLASVGEYAQAERVYRRLMQLVPDDPAIQAKQSALAAMARGGA